MNFKLASHIPNKPAKMSRPGLPEKLAGAILFNKFLSVWEISAPKGKHFDCDTGRYG